MKIYYGAIIGIMEWRIVLEVLYFQNFEIANETYDIPISEVMTKTPEEIFNYAVTNKKEIKIFETNQ